VLIGPPGVGKGTQAALLSGSLDACHLSTGDVFRAINTLPPSELTPTMSCALREMRAGKLVPYETVLSLISERSACLRCRGGFILDGFPRTFAQAVMLDEMLSGQNVRLDAVISYELPLKQIVSRISGRRTCSGCQAVYHMESHPPKTPGLCDECSLPLFQRSDDRPESVRVRLEVYEQSTAPVVDYYRRKGLLISVPADGSPKEIFEMTLRALEQRPKTVASKNGEVAPRKP